MMDREKLVQSWLSEEREAQIKGWDFSHIDGRYEEEQDLPWDYSAVIRQYLRPESMLLDIDTGGGEFLRSLGHPFEKTAATEGYPPNIRLCQEVLSPLGIDFRPADGTEPLPFDDEQFDLVINRHGDYLPNEIARVLKKGGAFVTEQVGAENDRDLAALLLSDLPPMPFPEQYLNLAVRKFEAAGFKVVMQKEVFRPIRFWDVGALVWFARILPWEFPDFSVERCLPGLFKAQELLERDGIIEGRIHRFLLAAEKLGD